MRDLVLIAIVLLGCVTTLRKPWIGVVLWTWLSIMNPHRYTYGFAYSAPLAAMAAVSLVLGVLMAKERDSPFKGSPVVWLVILMGWMTLSWLLGHDVANDYEQWKKVMKIDFMIIISLMVLRTKEHIWALLLVCVFSIGFLAVKGGIFTLATGGSYRVWGPIGSYVEGNNEFALATIMIIPLVRFFQLQLVSAWPRHAATVAMILCAASALGSQSRGGLVAIVAMVGMLWWRGKRKFGTAIALVVLAVPLVAFMPDTWSDRMRTIQTYEEDGSAMGRINAWWVAWRIGMNYLTGVGFNPATELLFALYGEYPDIPRAAHSIYFQMLGNHGFIGLFLFLAVWGATWRTCGWLRKQKDLPPESQWTADLGAMCQVSLVGYAAGGAFLSLAYFDLPYNILVIVVLARCWVTSQAWRSESSGTPPRWMTLLRLAAPQRSL